MKFKIFFCLFLSTNFVFAMQQECSQERSGQEALKEIKDAIDLTVELNDLTIFSDCIKDQGYICLLINSKVIKEFIKSRNACKSSELKKSMIAIIHGMISKFEKSIFLELKLLMGTKKEILKTCSKFLEISCKNSGKI